MRAFNGICLEDVTLAAEAAWLERATLELLAWERRSLIDLRELVRASWATSLIAPTIVEKSCYEFTVALKLVDTNYTDSRVKFR